MLLIGRWSTPPAEEEAKPKGFDDFELRLGDVMRGERATLAKSLLDVQRDLKIKATYIAAIENTDPSAFETQGFIAGYVRSYARYLNLDPEWAYNRFCEEGNFATAHGMSPEASGKSTNKIDQPLKMRSVDPLADPNATFIPRGEALLSNIEPGAVGSTMVLLALIGAIGFGGWSVLQEIQRVQFVPIDQAPGVVSTLDPMEASSAVIASADAMPGYDTPTADALDRLYRPEALDVPVLIARDGPISAQDPSQIGTWIEAPGDTTLVAQSAAAPAAPVDPLNGDIQVVAENAPEVVLFAVRPSWVRVNAADGSIIFEKILDAGEQYVLPKTEEPPLLRAGNAGSVYFAVNGENYGPAGEGPSVVKNVALAPAELKDAYAIADLDKDADLADFVAFASAQSQ